MLRHLAIRQLEAELVGVSSVKHCMQVNPKIELIAGRKLEVLFLCYRADCLGVPECELGRCDLHLSYGFFEKFLCLQYEVIFEHFYFQQLALAGVDAPLEVVDSLLDGFAFVDLF